MNAGGWILALVERCYKIVSVISVIGGSMFRGRCQILRPNFFSNSTSEIWIMVGRPWGQQ